MENDETEEGEVEEQEGERVSEVEDAEEDDKSALCALSWLLFGCGCFSGVLRRVCVLQVCDAEFPWNSCFVRFGAWR